MWLDPEERMCWMANSESCIRRAQQHYLGQILSMIVRCGVADSLKRFGDGMARGESRQQLITISWLQVGKNLHQYIDIAPHRLGSESLIHSLPHR